MRIRPVLNRDLRHEVCADPPFIPGRRLTDSANDSANDGGDAVVAPGLVDSVPCESAFRIRRIHCAGGVRGAP